MKKLITIALAVTSTLAFAGAPLGTAGAGSTEAPKKSSRTSKIVASEKPALTSAGTAEPKQEKTRATVDEKR